MNLLDFFACGISEAEKCDCLQKAEQNLRCLVRELEDGVCEKLKKLERLRSRRDTEWTISDRVLNEISSLRKEIDVLGVEKTELRDELHRVQNTATALHEEYENVGSAHRIELTQNGNVSSFHIVVKIKHESVANDVSPKVHEGFQSQECTLPHPVVLPRMGMTDWAFSDAFYREGKVVVVPKEVLHLDDEPIFVVGDVHGDVDSLQWVLNTTLFALPKSKVVFLGDLFDRGDEKKTLDTLRLFVWAIHAFSGRILWLKGNHDNLIYDVDTESFSSNASPHEFADFLNAHSDVKSEGLYLCGLLDKLPVAAIIGDVWISHGGILQDDVQGMKSFESFGKLTEPMISDFMWSRMVDAPSKLANRTHRGAEVGYEQAVRFVEVLKSHVGVEIKHIVCGHQHLDKDGYGYVNFERNYNGHVSCQCVCSFAHENVMGNE